MRRRTEIAAIGAGLAKGEDCTMPEFGTAAERTVAGARSTLGAVGPAAGGASSDGQHARICSGASGHAGGQQDFRF